jgi:hypothetical protein
MHEMDQSSRRWIDEMAARYSAISAGAQVELLAVWLHNLTVVARGFYPPPGEDPDAGTALRLIALNEVNHQITNGLMRLAGNRHRYPDDEFLSRVFGQAARGECARDTAWAFEQALRDVDRSDNPDAAPPSVCSTDHNA